MLNKDAIDIAYITRPSKQLNLFSEFRASPEGFSETTFGFKLKFHSGIVTGCMNTYWKFTSAVQVMMDAMLMTQWNTTIDFARPEKPVTFGIALSFGGGM